MPWSSVPTNKTVEDGISNIPFGYRCMKNRKWIIIHALICSDSFCFLKLGVDILFRAWKGDKHCAFMSLPHIITVTSQWTRWRPKSPASRLFIQPFIQAQKKDNIKAMRRWLLCEGDSPVSGEFPVQRASNAENVSIWWRHHINFALRSSPVIACGYLLTQCLFDLTLCLR